MKILSAILIGALLYFSFVVLARANSSSSSLESASVENRTLPSVVSINLCADQLVLAFAAESQILSLSNLSHDAAGSVYAEAARAYPTNTGQVEEILPLQPDIVIAGQFTSRYTLQLLESVGLRVELLPIADSIDSLQQNVLAVTRWLNRPELGVREVSRMQRRLDALSLVTEPKPRAAVYDPNGYTVGDKSLRGQSLTLAGWHNVATDKAIDSYGSLSLESLIMLQPDAMFESPYSPDSWSRGQALSVHPALRQRGLQAKLITVPSALTICGGPWTVDLIHELAEERVSLQIELNEKTDSDVE